MGSHYDPYYEMLEIKPSVPRPISFYKLLGVEDFESDIELIHRAGEKQLQHLRSFSTGPHGDDAENLINRVTQAILTLTKVERKLKYDTELNLRIPQNPVPLVVTESPVAESANTNSTPAPFEIFDQPEQFGGIGSQGHPGMPVSVASPANTAKTFAANQYQTRKSYAVWYYCGGMVAIMAILIVTLKAKYSGKSVSDSKPIPSEISKPKEIAKSEKSSTPLSEKKVLPKAIGNDVPRSNEEASEVPVPQRQEKNIADGRPRVVGQPSQSSPPTVPDKFASNNALSTRSVSTETGIAENGDSAILPRTPSERVASLVSSRFSQTKREILNDELVTNRVNWHEEFLLFGDKNWTDYTFSFEVLCEGGGSGSNCFSIVFRSPSDSKIAVFNRNWSSFAKAVEVWTPNNFKPASQFSNSSDQTKYFIDDDRWHTVTLHVEGKRVAFKYDSIHRFHEDIEDLPTSGRVGFRMLHGASERIRIRNIHITDPKGATLWRGLPDIANLKKTVIPSSPPPTVANSVNDRPALAGWVHDGGSFKLEPNGTWSEIGPDKKRWTYELVEATDEYIELRRPDKSRIRLSQNACHGWFLNNQVFRKFYSGRFYGTSLQELRLLASINRKIISPRLQLTATQQREYERFTKSIELEKSKSLTRLRKLESDYLDAFEKEKRAANIKYASDAQERTRMNAALDTGIESFKSRKRLSLMPVMLPHSIPITKGKLREIEVMRESYADAISEAVKASQKEIAARLATDELSESRLLMPVIFVIDYKAYPNSASNKWYCKADNTLNFQNVKWSINAKMELIFTGPRTNEPGDWLDTLKISKYGDTVTGVGNTGNPKSGVVSTE